ncbi:s-adenosylmethionine decarboxylase proenzyme [gamma proteobacterium HdN1]|nr:s-adenosylmethionine decarboxylase proenzyme [gamma proteobacterium HdN1]
MPHKLKLHGFNNLTKAISFNIYDISYAKTADQRKEYRAYVDELYNAERLIQILTGVTEIIGARVLSVAHQDYDPEGSSVAMLIGDHEHVPDESEISEGPGPLPDTVLGHLDKSHVTVHTYPETSPDHENGISTFRVDIDVATCGLISPLKALNYLIHSFDSDIVTVDYRVRGFTRDINGTKHFIDHEIGSIQNFLSDDTLAAYEMIDVNVFQENIFHTKMLLKHFNLDNYLFGVNAADLSPSERDEISRKLRREMLEIYYGSNM